MNFDKIHASKMDLNPSGGIFCAEDNGTTFASINENEASFLSTMVTSDEVYVIWREEMIRGLIPDFTMSVVWNAEWRMRAVVGIRCCHGDNEEDQYDDDNDADDDKDDNGRTSPMLHTW